MSHALDNKRFGSAAKCGLLAGLLLLTGACNQVSFLVPAPNPRGVTIPVPPPSFTSEPVQSFDIEGELANSAMDDGIRISLFEETSQKGYFTYTAGGSWLLADVEVDTSDNCLSVWSSDFEGQDSVREYFKLQPRTGDECVPGCSEPDQDGVCICVELWSTGCG